MDAARRLFAEQGFAAVSMRKIADAVEYSPTAIYLHFKDKEDLLRQVCNDDFAQFYAVTAAAAVHRNPVERVRHMGRAYVRFAVEHPNHFRRMFMDPPMVAMDDSDLAGRGDLSADGYALFKAQVKAAKASWRRPYSTDTELAAQVLWAAVHGVASLAVAHGRPDAWVKLKQTDLLTESMIGSILRGMLKPAGTKGNR